MCGPGLVRTYRGYDVFRDDDDGLGSSWYAVLAEPRDGPDDEALVTYPDERSLRAAIDATFRAPGAA